MYTSLIIHSGVDAPAQDSVSAEQLEEALETRIMTELKSYVNAHLGDMITIDLNRHLLQLEVSDEELQSRRSRIVKPDHPAYGVLKKYRRIVDGAEEGATWLF